jgi:prepilin-type N-terminal cleavage/methylation domain-containing protein
MTKRANRREAGVTLLELILVMVLIGILSAIIVVPVMTGARAWSDMTRQKEVTQQARIGLDRFVRELRAIQRVNGRPSITVAWLDENAQPQQLGPSRVRFVTATGDDLEYSWAGAGQSLVRTDWTDWTAGPVARDNAALNVQNFDLIYYEDSNAEHPQFRQEAEAATPPPVLCGGVACVPTVDAAASNDALVLLNAAQPAMTLNFSGTRIAWIGPRDSNLGIATVQIDADPPGATPIFTGPVDQYASVVTPQQPLFMSQSLAYGPYILTISFTPGQQNASSLGDAVSVDAFELVISRVVVELVVGDGEFTTNLRDQVSFRRVE